MSVKVLDQKSLKLITVFLIESFDPEVIGDYRPFKVFWPEKNYPILCSMLKRYRKNGGYFKIAQKLSIWNCRSYAKKYPQEVFLITEEARFFTEVPPQWYHVYYRISSVQIHKTLSCYLYQINDDITIIQELNKLCVEYGEWLLKQTPEWGIAKWE